MTTNRVWVLEVVYRWMFDHRTALDKLIRQIYISTATFRRSHTANIYMLRRKWEIGDCEQSPANVHTRQIARRLYTIAGDCSQFAWYLADVGNS